MRDFCNVMCMSHIYIHDFYTLYVFISVMFCARVLHISIGFYHDTYMFFVHFSRAMDVLQ
jgi:hypothetical protein